LHRFSFLATFSCLISVGIAEPSHGDTVQDYYGTLVAFFKPQHLIPTIIPRDEQPGNVYEMSNLRLLADRNSCFPGLVIPNATDTILPHVAVKRGLNAGLALGVDTLASADASLGAAEETNIEFTDAKSVEVPAMTLIAQYNPQNCTFLQAEVDATKQFVPMQGGVPLLVIGEVISAKRNLRFVYNDSAKAKAELSLWKGLISRFGVKASANADAASDRSVLVATQIALPVAIRPAFVPDQMAGASLGGGGEIKAVWYPLDLQNHASHGHFIDQMAEDIGKALPTSDK
jgi:hypothetical protein